MARQKYKPIPDLTPEEIERFWQRVDKSNPAGCWEWKACRTGGGYGSVGIKRNGKTEVYTASRIAFYIQNGEDPGRMSVAHHCDNPPCVRADHLFKATQSMNAFDSIAKGRFRRASREVASAAHIKCYIEHPEYRPVGEKNGYAKLTETQVIKILRLLRTTNMTHEAIANEFNVNRSTVSMISRCEIWKHIPRF